ncbi:MAG: isoprenylcysteine carboxylmethyltransferase family protein [Candidatus Aminicenantes bacterium]|nr:MAG: isoprenylcysteine carboxylmethyltransferase family protein [Candidatus Aminicenantes bacterium]
MSNVKTNIDKKNLIMKVIIRFTTAFVMLALLFFLPARTIYFWEAWVFMALLFIPATYVLFYLLKKDPELLEKRMKMKEKEKEQKLIMKISLLFFIGAFLLPGFDKYYGWSSIPLWLKIFADMMVLLGYIMFVVVLLQNRYASRIIEVDEKQKVIDTGLYSVVRHPMYDAVFLIYGFAPLALGSYWMLLGSAYLILVVVFRILNEEKVLIKELAGYKEYMQKVRYRLIPGLW